MDPATGIGFAAAVVQLVNFGVDAAKTCGEVYRQGSTTENADIQYTTTHLAKLTQILQQSLKDSTKPTTSPTQEEQKLIELSEKCRICAEALQQELLQLQRRSSSSSLETFKKGAQAVLKRRTIAKIYDQLETHKSTLEIAVLFRLRCVHRSGMLLSSGYSVVACSASCALRSPLKKVAHWRRPS